MLFDTPVFFLFSRGAGHNGAALMRRYDRVDLLVTVAQSDGCIDSLECRARRTD